VAQVLTKVAPVVLTRKPKWWSHPQTLVQLMRIKDGNGRPIFLSYLEAPDLAQGNLGTLLGHPTVPTFVAPSVDGPGQAVATFGDGNNQVVAVRTDFNFESSDHYQWNLLERSFRCYGRAATGARTLTGHATLFTAAR
jgi:HK97 family phage major capsid protein